MELLRGQQATWLCRTYAKYPDCAVRAQQRYVEGCGTRQGGCPQPGDLAVLVDPLGDSVFLGVKRQEHLASQPLARAIGSSTPGLQATRGIGEQQAHLALEDLMQMACSSLEQAAGVRCAGELAAQRVERRGATFPVAGRFGLLSQTHGQCTDNQRHQ